MADELDPTAQAPQENAGNPNELQLTAEDRPDFSKIGEGKREASRPEITAEEPEKQEPKPEDKPESTPSKNLEDPSKPEKKKVEKPKYEPKLEDLPEDDSDLDSIKPKKGFSTEQEKNFRELGDIAKKQRAIARLAKQQLEEAQARLKEYEAKQGELPEEVKSRLSEADRIAMMMNAENDPVFQREYVAKIGEVEESLYGFLKKHGLPDDQLEEIRKEGVDQWPFWGDVEAAFRNPLDRRELTDLLKGRRDAIGAKEMKLKELASDRESYKKLQTENEIKDQTEWAKKAEKFALEQSAKYDWAWGKKIPDNATPEQKAAIEAHNASLKGRSDQLAKDINGIYSRDPETGVRIALAAMHADILSKENETVTRERDKAMARVTELENQLAKIKGAGRIAHDTSSPAPSRPKSNEIDINEDGASALGKFLKTRGK